MALKPVSDFRPHTHCPVCSSELSQPSSGGLVCANPYCDASDPPLMVDCTPANCGSSVLLPDTALLLQDVSNYQLGAPSGSAYAGHFQPIKISTNLGRKELFELGRRGPYHRYVTFPVEVKEDISLPGEDVKPDFIVK